MSEPRSSLRHEQSSALPQVEEGSVLTVAETIDGPEQRTDPEQLRAELLATTEAAPQHFDAMALQLQQRTMESAASLGMDQRTVDAVVSGINYPERLAELQKQIQELVRNTQARVHDVSSGPIMTREAINAALAEHSSLTTEEAEILTAEKPLEKMEEIFRSSPERALAISENLYLAAPETTMTGIEKAREDEKGMEQTMEQIAEALKTDDMDAQYAMMQTIFAQNPDRYVAAMERLTYRLDPETSRQHADKKNRLIEKQLLETLEASGITTMDQQIEVAAALEKLSLQIETEIAGRILDTHATTMGALVSLIQTGSLESAQSRRAKGEDVKSTKGDDLKLAGSMSVFTYMGGYHSVDRDVFIEVDPEWLDDQPDSFYLTEDYVLKPPKTLDVASRQPRKSFSEKLGDVMGRSEARQYLSTKIAAHIIEQAVRNGVSIEDLSGLESGAGNILQYLADNSRIDMLPNNLLGGRPEGHLPFDVPLGKCKIKMPRQSLEQAIVQAQKQLDTFQKKGLDFLIAPTEQYIRTLQEEQQKLGADASLADMIRHRLALHIQELQLQLANDPENTDLAIQIENLTELSSNFIEYDTDITGARSVVDKVYAENLGVEFAPHPEAAAYGKINFCRRENGTAIHAGMEDGHFAISLARSLEAQGIVTTIENGVVVAQANPEDLQEATYKAYEQFLLHRSKAEKLLQKQINKDDLIDLGYSPPEAEQIDQSGRRFDAALDVLINQGQLGIILTGEDLPTNIAALLEGVQHVQEYTEFADTISTGILLNLIPVERATEILGRDPTKILHATEHMRTADAANMTPIQIRELMRQTIEKIKGRNYAALLRDAGLQQFSPLIGLLKRDQLKTRADLEIGLSQLKKKPPLTDEIRAQLAEIFELE